MPFLFSYGTLQEQRVQLQLFGRRLQGKKDVLAGYKICVIEITDESFLSKGEGRRQRTLEKTNNEKNTVEGTVLNITGEELSNIDMYEPANYKRTLIMLQSGTKAWIYLAG